MSVGWRLSWALTLSLLGGCRGEPAVATRSAIVGGEPAPEAAAVVAIVERQAACAPLPAVLRCTGALVGRRVVLTAAHCLGDGRAADLAVSFGAVIGEGTVVSVARGMVHPDHDPETRRFDLAVLVLEADAPSDVVPLALELDPLDSSWTGELVEMIGYGAATADATEAGVRLRGTARIDAVSDTELRLVPDPAMSCRGDSGGPVLSGEGQLVAVTSNGDPACVEYALAGRVDVVADFLDGALRAADEEPSPRRAFDPAEHFCDATCIDDTDCPEGTGCFGPPGAPRRCVLPGLAPGELTESCEDDRACGDEPCVATPAGCRCFLSCGLHSHGADAGVAARPAGGGGCAAGGTPEAAGSWWLVLLLLPVLPRLGTG